MQPVRRLGVDAAIIFSDILIPVEAMGMRAGARATRARTSRTRCAPRRTSRSSRVPDPAEGTGFLAEAIRRTREALHDSVPVIGFSGAPFTLAAYMVEGGGSQELHPHQAAALRAARSWRTRCSRSSPTRSSRYLKMQVEAGARMRADLRLVGRRARPARLRDASACRTSPGWSQALKATGVPVIVFGTAMSTHLPLLKRTGADVHRPRLAHRAGRRPRRVLGPDVAVQGNLDPLALFLPREELEARVRGHPPPRRAAGAHLQPGPRHPPPTDPEAAKAHGGRRCTGWAGRRRLSAVAGTACVPSGGLPSRQV